MTSEVIPMKASGQLNRMGLPPEVLLHATLLCNNLRLSATTEELAVEVAQANGVVSGMHIGKAISKPQLDQLHALFRVMAQVTQAQHAVLAEQQPQCSSCGGTDK